MIEFVSGDMFERHFDVRVNTVNCVGVMGAGVALAFKERYPEMFKEYRRECNAGRIRPGALHIWQRLGGEWIINFPTKRDWRDDSRYEDIESGLVALRIYLSDKGPVTVALPALGCGHGGLDWNRVSSMIQSALNGLPAKISVFEPRDSREIGKKVTDKALDVNDAELDRAGVKVIGEEQANFPERLRGTPFGRIYFRGSAELLDEPSAALVPSLKPTDREELAATALADALSRQHVAISVVLSGKVARRICETAIKHGARILAWLPQGMFAEKLPSWTESFVESGSMAIASVAPAKMRWSPQCARDSSAAAAMNAKAVVASDPEPMWITRAPWRSRHESDKTLFYILYSDMSDQARHLWQEIDAVPIKRKASGQPNIDPVLSTLARVPVAIGCQGVQLTKASDEVDFPPVDEPNSKFKLETQQTAVTSRLFADLDDVSTTKSKRRKKDKGHAGNVEFLPPNLGKPLKVAVPDFSDPNRPKTCLEVDFPLVPINALSSLEGNAGKPIYQMSKWWARRRSCVFRALLLAAAMEAPAKKHPDGTPMKGPDGKPIIDEDVADQAVWDAYYANHQAAGSFKHLRVLDPFMGGGTTLVEGSRLGFHVAGVDLNPVAWFIVKNELACTDPKEVKAFFDHIEAEVKPQIQPFYVTDGVGGRKGVWFKASAGGTREEMPAGFDPIALPPDQRKDYQYEGPEIIYTFWAKHGPCGNLTCGHRTPIFRSPIVVTKKLGVKYLECTCKACKIAFHAELGDARIAPDAEQVVLGSEHPYTIVSPRFAKALLDYDKGERKEIDARIAGLADALDAEPGLKCPRCGQFAGQFVRDILAKHRDAKRYSEVKKKDFGILPKGQGKKPIYCTLLVDPDWMRGAPGKVSDDTEYGGYVDAPVERTRAWYRERLKSLRLIEVRGMAGAAAGREQESSADAEPANTVAAEDDDKISVPPTITLRDGRIIDTRAETIARKANGKENDGHFTCAAPGGGHQMHFAKSVQATRRTAPVAPYVIQVYDPKRDEEGYPYGGRFFKAPNEADIERMIAAEREWEARKDADLDGCWPREELPFSYMTHQANFALPEQGYTHWYKMFNTRQLMVHATLLKAITKDEASDAVKHQALGALQQYLRNQNSFAFFHMNRDCLAPALSNPNYHPKPLTVESPTFCTMGYGSWVNSATAIIDGLEYANHSWDIALPEVRVASGLARLPVGDRVKGDNSLQCGSSSELSFTEPFDLVITDPPFGDNIYYSDLSNFFYAWLRLPLKGKYPDLFGPTKTPNAQEALKPRALPDADGNKHYYDRLTPCWAEACRVMKDGGLMAFTFHHSEDAQWEIVLRSLFEAGFYLEATYPIASDEMKGKGGQFGAKGTEYDIIHVCRKRLEAPKPVSWPKMRQWVKGEMMRLRPLLESYKTRGLQDADVRVILRGKALEFYSRHYGTVMVSAPGGEDLVLSIRDALLGINQLLDELSGAPGERPPSIVQPVVYQYLRLFGMKASYSRDEVSKLLRGTAIQPRDFERTGSTPWIVEEDKVVSRVPIHLRFPDLRKLHRNQMRTELDQAHFLVGAAFEGSGVNIDEELGKTNFHIRPGVEALLDWYSKTPPGADEPGVPKAAATALQLLRAAFEAKRARMHKEDPTLWEEWEASLATVA